MSEERDEFQGVWFVYDGECPICQLAASALRIQETCGPLQLVDARRDTQHWLIKEAHQRDLDINEGMVIYHDGYFYHGDTALVFMSVYGATDGFFNRLNRFAFKSRIIAKASYPVMRFVRNILLKLRQQPKIQSLANNNTTSFEPVFGEGWQRLPTVLKKHYANRPYSQDEHMCQGELAVYTNWLMRLLGPLAQFFTGLPIANEENVPVTVKFKSNKDDNHLVFDRTFEFSQQGARKFRSKMRPLEHGFVIEETKGGFCWKSHFSWQGDHVELAHKGYYLKVMSLFIRLPITWLVGQTFAQEKAIDDDHFSMFVQIQHPLFGKLYEYRGWFKMVESDA